MYAFIIYYIVSKSLPVQIHHQLFVLYNGYNCHFHRNDYESEKDFLEDRITSVLLSTNQNDPYLIADGYTCIGGRFTEDKNDRPLPGGVFLWIKRDPKVRHGDSLISNFLRYDFNLS